MNTLQLNCLNLLASYLEERIHIAETWDSKDGLPTWSYTYDLTTELDKVHAELRELLTGSNDNESIIGR
jgi:hypothetical protein